MSRTRVALLSATAECIARYGVRKTTMVDVASRSKVAKATLYNHFRTKQDVLAAFVEALVEERVEIALATAASTGLVAALDELAGWLADYPPLRTTATGEPALLAPLAFPGPSPSWDAARTGVAQVLTAAGVPAGPAQVELVLRWVCSQLLWPALRGGQALAAGLQPGAEPPAEPPVQTRADVSAVSRDVTAVVPGLGWPH